MKDTRTQTLAVLRATQTQPIDILIVGGGIVGAGIARDAALRGFRVALVEQNDLGSGTSSRPTRLIHGGLRYLESYDFGLVREDLKEREILLRVAPHLVFPLPFLLPQYERSALYRSKLRAGMQLYDLLSFDKSLPSRRWLPREEVLTAEPTINADGLQGAWRYYDAQVPLVERLVVENALDAAQHGAVILTHARLERFERDAQGRVVGALVQDLETHQYVTVRAHLVVNATGPWLDMTDGQLRPGKPPLLRLTKGVHLVTPSGTRNAYVLFSQSDGRLFFVVPWLGYSLVGTTDTDYSGDPTNAATTQEEACYLATEAGHTFPQAPFDQIHYAYAGVRALVRVEGVKEGQVSRKHRVLDYETNEGIPGLISVVGGKITAYRGIAEEVGDLVSRKLGRRTRTYTERRPYPGGALGAAPDVASYIETQLWPRAQGLGLTRAQADHLGRVYGALSQDVLTLAERDRTLAQPLAPGCPAVRAEVVQAVEHEWARTLGDFLLRRSDLGLLHDQALGYVDHVADVMGEILGWDRITRAEQIARYQAELEPLHRVSTLTPTLPSTSGVAESTVPSVGTVAAG